MSIKSHSTYYVIKQDYFFWKFHWWYFLFNHNTFFLAILFIANEHMFFQHSCHVFWFIKFTWQSDLNIFSQYFTKKSVTSIHQYQNLDYHSQMLCHFLKYQITNLTIKNFSVCYYEQNSSLLFHSILQENMSFYQKSSFKYDTSYFIKTSFLWLSSMRSHFTCHAIKQDLFF